MFLSKIEKEVERNFLEKGEDLVSDKLIPKTS